MKHRQIILLSAIITLALTPCFAHHMAVVVNKDNAAQNVTSAQLAKIIKGETRKWQDGKEVILVLHASSAGETATLTHLTKMSGGEVKAMLASHKASIRTVSTDANVIETVSATSGALGFVEEHSLDSRISVVKVDGKLPLEAGYLPH